MSLNYENIYLHTFETLKFIKFVTKLNYLLILKL